ncbi:MAG: hypothetical protein KDD40_04690 [Bdellovibrionales bacterium]|nr:hypothetical protein [Bdellovibrionales bacterium]
MAFCVLLLELFNNCSSAKTHNAVDSGSNAEISDENLFVAADYLSTEKPEVLCGEEGYAYLLKEYFGVHCAVCHDPKGGFEPYFANNNDSTNSYYKALYINEETLLETITNNRFCGTECSLNKKGETYTAIAEWLENKWACN